MIETLESNSTADPHLSQFIAGYWRLTEWNQAPQETLGFLKAHLELGISSVDHADIYGDYQAEELFGRAIKLQPDIRQRIQIVSKCGIKLLSANRPDHREKHYDSGREHIINSVDNSLKSLQTDYLDLLLIHRPDPLMDADETAAAFTKLHNQGKVLHFGVSNFSPAQFDLLQSRLSMPLVTNQVEFSPLNLSVLEDGTLDHCQLRRISPMIWSPLGGGYLFTGEEEKCRSIRGALEEVASRYDNAQLDQIVYAWILAHPARPKPILGSQNIDRIASACKAQDIRMERQDWFRILRAAAGQEVP